MHGISESPAPSSHGRRSVILSLALIALAPAAATATAPTAITPPSIEGTAQVGQTLTANPGTWSGTQPLTYSYQWQRCDNYAVAGEGWVSRTTNTNQWYGMDWGGPSGAELFVAVSLSGAGNRVMTSPDGTTWTTRSTPVDNNWTSVAWGGPAGDQKFVAVSETGTNNRVMTSPDGITWTVRTSAANNNWRAVAWGGPAGQEKFVAVAAFTGTGNRVMTSPDGITWTTQTSAADNDWLGVTWGGPAGQEKFVAVAMSGTGNRVMTSPDGVTWTARTTPANNNWNSVVWGGPAGQEKFVAVGWTGTNNRVMTSPDGITWTAQATPSNANFDSVAWGGIPGQQRFVAVADNPSTGESLVISSPDGVTWTAHEAASNNAWHAVEWGGAAGRQTFVAVAYGGSSERAMTSAAPACADIVGATSATYTVQAADEGRFLRVRVTAANGVAPDAVAYSPILAQSARAAAAPSGTPALTVRLLPQRTRLVSGQTMRVGIRTTNTGTASASQVTSCIRLPSNLAIVRSANAVRAGRTLCFRQGDIAAGRQATRAITVRGVSIRRVSRTLVGSARAAGQSRVSAPPRAVTIRPRAVRARVTG